MHAVQNMYLSKKRYTYNISSGEIESVPSALK